MWSPTGSHGIEIIEFRANYEEGTSSLSKTYNEIIELLKTDIPVIVSKTYTSIMVYTFQGMRLDNLYFHCIFPYNGESFICHCLVVGSDNIVYLKDLYILGSHEELFMEDYTESDSN